MKKIKKYVVAVPALLCGTAITSVSCFSCNIVLSLDTYGYSIYCKSKDDKLISLLDGGYGDIVSSEFYGLIKTLKNDQKEINLEKSIQFKTYQELQKQCKKYSETKNISETIYESRNGITFDDKQFDYWSSQSALALKNVFKIISEVFTL